MPSFSLIFGLLTDAFNKPGVKFLDEILKISLYFLWAGLGALLVTYMQNAFWTLTSTRQTTRIRNSYLVAILRQEIGWFDQTPSGELTTRIAG
jgi:ATP-binding cassette subfamily B (MDR/TAP) protein 1